MVTKVRGAFNEFAGEAVVDGADPSKSNVRVTAQVASIDTRNAMRDDHLRTNDFLDDGALPGAHLRLHRGVALGGNDFEVTGDLTVKGVTKSVTLPLEFQGAATDPFGNERIGFEGSATIQRSDFGVTYNAALETGGVLVSDKIVLEFEISAIKSA